MPDLGEVYKGHRDDRAVGHQLAEEAVAVDTLRAGHLMVLLHFGNMSQDTVRYNSELFAREVMPKVSGLFSDWEDTYWPAPSPVEAR